MDVEENMIFIDSRVVKVTAGAGCGKSYFISSTIEELLASGVQLNEIAYILFNRAPAEAFRERFVKQGYTKEDIIWLSTHHSMCRRLLKLSPNKILNLPRWGKEHGFDLSSEETIKREGIDQYGWDAVFSSMQKKIYEGKNNFTSQEERLLNALKETERTSGEYAHIRYLQKALLMDMFPVGVKYLFIDEAQDNGKLQFDWIRRIVDNRPEVAGIMLAGDDKQAINGFKGGNAELFLDFPADRCINLGTTFRMPVCIMNEANRIISPVQKRSELTSMSANMNKGAVIYAQVFDDALPDVVQAVKEGKDVLILIRNKCFEFVITHALSEMDIIAQNSWSIELRNVLLVLWNMRTTGLIKEETIAALFPSEKKTYGQIKAGYVWDIVKMQKLRTGDFVRDKTMFWAYEMIRVGEGLLLERATEIGLKESFVKDVMLWKLDAGCINIKEDSIYLFRQCIKRFGWSFKTPRVETIHAVKGEEADVVVLVGNVTERTLQGERDDEDNERRVWHVGASRAREKLIITNLPQYDKRTTIL